MEIQEVMVEVIRVEEVVHMEIVVEMAVLMADHLEATKVIKEVVS